MDVVGHHHECVHLVMLEHGRVVLDRLDHHVRDSRLRQIPRPFSRFIEQAVESGECFAGG
jgi:hypothetical protein